MGELFGDVGGLWGAEVEVQAERLVEVVGSGFGVVAWDGEAGHEGVDVGGFVLGVDLLGEGERCWNWLSVLLYCDLDLPFSRPVQPVDKLPVSFEQGVVEIKVHPEHRTLLWPELHTRDEQRQAREMIEAEYSARPKPEELVEIDNHDGKLDGWIPEINNQIRQEKFRRAAERSRYEELTVLP